MKKNFFSRLRVALLISALAALPLAAQNQWAKNIGGTGIQDHAYRTATDKDGNVFVVGVFSGQNVHFGSNIYRTSTPTINADLDFFLAKYSRAGECLWVRNVPGAAPYGGLPGLSFGITVDPAGNPVICGQYDGDDRDFGGMRSGRNSGNFVAKYHTGGSCFWISTNTDSARWYASVGYPFSVTNDARGNIYVTGTFHGKAVIFGSSFLVNGDLNLNNMYVAKYNASGQIQWVRTNIVPPGVHPIAYGIFAYDIRWAPYNMLYVTGVYGGTRIEFEGGYKAPLDSFNLHIFTLRLDTTGRPNLLTYSRGFGGYYRSTVVPAHDDVDGPSYYVAAYSGSSPGNYFDFGNGFRVGGDSLGNNHTYAFLIKYNYSGTVRWVRPIKTSWWCQISDIKRDRTGSIQFAATVGGGFPVDFGGATYQPQGQDFVVLKYSPAGNCTGLRTTAGVGPSEYIAPAGFDIDPFQDNIATGFFRGNYAFAPLPAISNPEMNAFIVKGNAVNFAADDSLKFILNRRSAAAGDTASLFIRATVPLERAFSAIQMNLNYDSAKLEFRGIDTSGTRLGELRWAMHSQLTNKIRIGAYGPNEMVQGGVLLKLRFLVKPGSTGIAKVNFDTTFVNTGSFPVDTVNGWFSISGGTTTLYGDADLNGLVNEFDMTAVYNALLTGPPLTGQAYTNANVTLDPTLSVLDVATIERYLNGHIPSLPDRNRVSADAVFPNNKVYVFPGDTVKIPVLITDYDSLFSFFAKIEYDPAKFTFAHTQYSTKLTSQMVRLPESGVVALGATIRNMLRQPSPGYVDTLFTLYLRANIALPIGDSLQILLRSLRTNEDPVIPNAAIYRVRIGYDPLYGDANLNGTIEGSDITAIFNSLLLGPNLTGQAFLNADVTLDGSLSFLDARQIQLFLEGQGTLPARERSSADAVFPGSMQQVLQGDTLIVRVTVTDHDSIMSLYGRIEYDHAKLTFLTLRGSNDLSVWTARTPEPGLITLGAAIRTMLRQLSPGYVDTLVTIAFLVNSALPTGDSLKVFLTNLRLNEGPFIPLAATYRARIGSGQLYGDVNLDGAVNMNDLDYFTHQLLRGRTFSGVQRQNANLSLDTSVSVLDAVILGDYLAGAIPSIPSRYTAAAKGIFPSRRAAALPGAYAEFPIVIQQADSIRSIGFRLDYDRSKLELSYLEALHFGILAGFDTLNTFRVASGSPLVYMPPGSSINAFRVSFRVRESVPLNEVIPVRLKDVRMNENYYAAEAAVYEIAATTGIAESTMPAETRLHSGYPNPFNGQTTLQFDLAQPGGGEITLFDITGKIVQTILLPERPAGSYAHTLDFGATPSGIYFCRVRLNNKFFTQKLVLIK